MDPAPLDGRNTPAVVVGEFPSPGNPVEREDSGLSSRPPLRDLRSLFSPMTLALA